MLEKKYTEKTFTLEILYHIGALEDSIHFIFDHDTKTCAIIDPAWDASLFIQRIHDKGYTLTDIWLTHWHFDHTNAVDEIVEKTGAKITVGIYEVPYLQIDNLPETVEHNDTIFIGKTAATIINTPGHSAGGICYLLDGHLIAGDTLFVYGAGHCSLPGGNISELFNSMQKLKQVDDAIMLHCGHDYGCKIETTMGEQKQGNAYLLIDNEADFVRFVEGMSIGQYPYPTEALTKTEVQTML
ncbi:MBL-fold metallo-hydrolase superfamily [uncultured Gammaproteobacteria bacterium]|jgi:glyoxylase-like metal-dependent hydrolase (beta-lactamase superfamily II)|nr:MBL-fold metallo-hydrolase superfamily [uncultured Gammaproteobacteria bacterium]CAC9567681.1 MBL-fold metallo-hydrolase superfamily [uncultured Gammaproteobacteria bacterium]CAC9577787.1 MBL-fold metallo-hydrolase superfamily [uncultured Gammaproteobacteria bacterium]CAC9580980.1 MBL-fold metallo-hydrolase superfamily [uncultured Gammaproteobacteria bacterium]CAC9581748.1 MBL-fold metallo-hydrolase superfamily [uncultured Gammaproteobacteria bacterium]